MLYLIKYRLMQVTGGCAGPEVDMQKCNTHITCPSQYSSWTQWSECDAACGYWTTTERRRMCLNQSCNEGKFWTIRKFPGGGGATGKKAKNSKKDGK